MTEEIKPIPLYLREIHPSEGLYPIAVAEANRVKHKHARRHAREQRDSVYAWLLLLVFLLCALGAFVLYIWS